MFLGIDLGTSSIKAVLADQTGTLMDHESAEYPVCYPHEGWSEQSPQDWLEGLYTVLAGLGSRHDLSRVEGISFCGQMHGLVVLDKADQVIRPALLWNDNRTVTQTDALNREPGREELVRRTGNIAITGFTAPKLLWLRENEPEHFARICKIMLPKDYLLYTMSGVFATDVSDASGTLLFDVEHRCWSAPMLERLDLTAGQLPRVFESYEPVGTVDLAFAARTGLSPSALVVAGGGDQAVGAVGTGAVEKDTCSISLGTSGVVFAASDRFAADPGGRLHTFCHANGGYHMMGCILSAAAALDWWAESVLGRRDYDRLLAEVEGTEIDDLLFLPYLMGERSPINDPSARGSFSGLTLSKGRPAMTRAVLEGVSFALRDCYEVILEQGIRPAFARVIGGGSKSPVWLQILSNVLGLELHTINTHDGGALGAVLLAMTGCGYFPNVAAAAHAVIRDVDRYLPDLEQHHLYSEKFEQFRHLYHRNKL